MTASDLTAEDWTVRHYMQWLENEWRQSRGKVQLDLSAKLGKNDPKMKRLREETNRKNAAMCWRQLREARVFHVGDALVKQCYMRVHRFLTEEVVGYNYEDFWYEPDVNDTFHEGTVDPETLDYKHLIETWRAASVHAPWPEKFPFPAMVLGYGRGYQLNDLDMSGKWPAFMAHGLPEDMADCRVVAHLVTEEGYVWELAWFLTHDGQQAYSCEPFRMPKWTFGDKSMNVNDFVAMEIQTGLRTLDEVNAPGWRRTFDTTQWIVPSLMHVINQYRTLAIEGELDEETRREWRHRRKNMGLRPSRRRGILVPPPPFYHLKLETTVIKEKVDPYLDSMTPRPLRHRHDVRGHERCRIRRGPGPLSDKQRQKLEGMEYTVYMDGSQIKDEDVKRLILRNRPLRRPGEWLAIKTVWVRPHVRGDESLPYVPALRIATGD